MEFKFMFSFVYCVMLMSAIFGNNKFGKSMARKRKFILLVELIVLNSLSDSWALG